MLQKTLPIDAEKLLASMADQSDEEQLSQMINVIQKTGISVEEDDIQRYYQIFQNNVNAMQNYHPDATLEINTLLIKCNHEKPENMDSSRFNTLGWDQYISGKINRHEVKADHFNLMEQPQLAEWSHLILQYQSVE